MHAIAAQYTAQENRLAGITDVRLSTDFRCSCSRFGELRLTRQLVLGNAARIVALGLVIGTLLAVPALGWLQGQLFGVDGAAFWGIFGSTALVLTATALAAAAWPAWRAARRSDGGAPVRVAHGDVRTLWFAAVRPL